MRKPSRPTLIVLTHSFAPDPAAVGQYMADVSKALAARGTRVIVYTAKNGYDDPSIAYASREMLDGVDVRRVAFASVGKGSLPRRAAAAAWFTLRCLFATLTARGASGILVSTAPPLIGVVGWVTSKLRGIPYVYWAMDLNPDQLVALGHLAEDHPIARFLAAVDRRIVTQASMVVALDRFMARRLEARGPLRGPLRIIPPWSRDPAPVEGKRAENPFRVEHGWGNKIVFLYSGNHTTSNPLSTVLQSVRRLTRRRDVHFAFIGSGQCKQEIDDMAYNGARDNISSFPYQPFDKLSVTLPAGDVHITSLGEGMVGIIHPCKVYSAMAAGRPVLYVGPERSHITDLIERFQIGWVVSQGDVEGVTAAIEQIASLGPDALHEKGRAGQTAVCTQFSRERLCALFCDEIEAALSLSLPS